MAIGIGSRAALTTGASVTLGNINAQPPQFAIVDNASAPFTLLYPNGSTQSSVPAACVDEIVDADTTTKGFLGKKVNVTNYDAAYIGIVVAVYARVTPTPTTLQCVLVKTLSGEGYIEALSSNVSEL